MIKTIKIYPFLLICIFFISSCSTTSDFVFGEEQNTDEQILKEHILEWEQIKPEINELIKMSKSLQQLITELEELSDATEQSIYNEKNLNNEVVAKSTGPGISKQQDMSIHKSSGISQKQNNLPAKPEQPTTFSEASTPTSPSTTIKHSIDEQENAVNTESTDEIVAVMPMQYAIQLGSFSTFNTVKKEWTAFKITHANLFSEKSAYSESVLTDKGRTLYRLKVGPYSDKTVAKTLCAKLSKQHQSCLVNQLTGSKIE
ncbi:SPOR domain-containing protein [Thalassotalea profundi]|uniref:SPOR domain-containing protein n=1 Tax=Thalassotalea profundi TaxID=2036687 RepID=A0ABQ3J295_9GAMM|nr:SPOR domain-containing protein [Thalassotalea profundi]GHF00309.1 hypothetical protein GCM10011501_32300 [Thalassotalea profundi]